MPKTNTWSLLTTTCMSTYFTHRLSTKSSVIRSNTGTASFSSPSHIQFVSWCAWWADVHLLHTPLLLLVCITTPATLWTILLVASWLLILLLLDLQFFIYLQPVHPLMNMSLIISLYHNLLLFSHAPLFWISWIMTLTFSGFRILHNAVSHPHYTPPSVPLNSAQMFEPQKIFNNIHLNHTIYYLIKLVAFCCYELKLTSDF